ncbi:UTP11 protein (macronuclear) [Tetrahymena thermophila SB210]|uniref:U3 small nucleolar RNA-associated protein 11 n=1 Tax=Tetrahymena thermophila (strain SB210) TaxID=312017 RepID=I7M979_TETTS|nr:UTP11 protein [Tetrahymena thermophila SB210]EAS01071.1 UTP11 protein [Tetrahymena thermophila SB210]|eukprot:XP_001021316.1 UTP11 protein [Tetrahymena thermophila SB210]
MSSTTFKNLKIGRKHRERGQLKNREHLGILEKKKDYIQRAKHYHKINDQLNNLKLKARLKNENEFYHKMTKAKIVDGKHVEFEEEEDDFDPKEYRRLLKNQNINLIKIQKHKDMKQIEKLKSQLHDLDAPRQNTNIIFVDDKEEYENFDLVEHYNTTEEMIQNKSNILTKQQIEQQKEQLEQLNSKQINQKVKESYMKLKKVEENHKKMERAYQKLEFEKNLLGKEKRRIKKYKTGKVAKFFSERKK